MSDEGGQVCWSCDAPLDASPTHCVRCGLAQRVSAPAPPPPAASGAPPDEPDDVEVFAPEPDVTEWREPSPSPRSEGNGNRPAPAARPASERTARRHRATRPTRPGSADVGATERSTDPPRPSVLDHFEALARASHRADLVEQVDAVRHQVAATELRVLVAGEHKKGKSTLVNALLNADICPTGSSDAAGLPLWIRHGDELVVNAHHLDGRLERIPLEEVAARVLGEAAASGRDERVEDDDVMLIEVLTPRRLGAAGVCLIDTPPTAGDNSTGSLTVLQLVDAVDVLLFVSDATQELTASELAFLAAAKDRRARIILVEARSDLVLDADRIVAIDRRHLSDAGMPDIQVLALSAVLHLTALDDSDHQLEELSGFERLFELLAEARAGAVQLAADAAGKELAAVSAQLQLSHAARDRAEPLDRQIVEDRTRRITAESAPWRASLREGLDSIRQHSMHGRQRRQLEVRRRYKEALHVESRQSAARIENDDFFEFLYREIYAAFVRHQEWLQRALVELDNDLREDFALTVDAISFDLLEDLPEATRLEGVLRHDDRTERGDVLAALQGWSTAAVLTSTTGATAAAATTLTAVAAPIIAAPLALLLGPRFVREARRRRQVVQGGALREHAEEIVTESFQELAATEIGVFEDVRKRMVAHYLRQGEMVARSLEGAADPRTTDPSRRQDQFDSGELARLRKAMS